MSMLYSSVIGLKVCSHWSPSFSKGSSI